MPEIQMEKYMEDNQKTGAYILWGSIGLRVQLSTGDIFASVVGSREAHFWHRRSFVTGTA